jgi:DNA-binding transcriptional LysR family regulator
MDFRTIRTFVEVVRQGGFSQAAKVVFTTQSTVSKAVKQLETELGVALLDRRGHRSILTPEGDVVYRRALKILAEGDDLDHRTGRTARSQAGHAPAGLK